MLPEKYTGPGLLDLQLNGYAGLNFNGEPAEWTAAGFHRIAKALSRRGVMASLPTLITDAPEMMLRRAERYAKLLDNDVELASAFPRLHIEGPFISPETGPRGAHPRQHCLVPEQAPDLLDRLREASGERIGILTIAPELDGAIDLIRRADETGIAVAIGHTQASADLIARAVEAGARLSTHLGNGSHQMLPRLDNYVFRQLAEDRLHASFIADGHHMPFPTLKCLLRAKTPARSILITDAIAATGMAPGRYKLVGREVEVRSDGRVCHLGQPNLAGSVLTLDKAIINVCLHCGVKFTEAWKMASVNPARLLGIDPPENITVQVTSDGFSRE